MAPRAGRVDGKYFLSWPITGHLAGCLRSICAFRSCTLGRLSFLEYCTLSFSGHLSFQFYPSYVGTLMSFLLLWRRLSFETSDFLLSGSIQLALYELMNFFVVLTNICMLSKLCRFSLVAKRFVGHEVSRHWCPHVFCVR